MYAYNLWQKPDTHVYIVMLCLQEFTHACKISHSGTQRINTNNTNTDKKLLILVDFLK